MILSEQQQLFARDVGKLLVFMYTQTNYRCTFGDAYRSQQQAEWNAQHGLGIQDSLHCQRLAIDLNLFDCGNKLDGNCTLVSAYNAYEQFGKYWESLDPQNRWGGYFVSKYGGHIVDQDHFERKPE